MGNRAFFQASKTGQDRYLSTTSSAFTSGQQPCSPLVPSSRLRRSMKQIHELRDHQRDSQGENKGNVKIILSFLTRPFRVWDLYSHFRYICKERNHFVSLGVLLYCSRQPNLKGEYLFHILKLSSCPVVSLWAVTKWKATAIQICGVSTLYPSLSFLLF